MKFLATLILIISIKILFSQDVCVEGHVNCLDQSEEERAKFIIIIPGMPREYLKLAEITDRKGYFRLFLPYKEVIDKKVVFFCIGKSGKIEADKRYFGREDIRRNNTIKLYPSILSDYACDEMNNNYFEAQQQLDDIIKNKTFQKLKKNGDSATSMIGATINDIMIIARLVMLKAEAEAPDEDIVVEREEINIKDVDISPKQNKQGIFLNRAYSELSQNIGFNFTPARNLNEAIFWNPSAILLAVENQLSLHTDWKRYLRTSVLFNMNQSFGVAAGFYMLRQKESRTVELNSNFVTENFICEEGAANISFAAKVSKTLYLGFSSKLIYQTITNPVGLIKTTFYSPSNDRHYTELSYIKETISPRKIDFDVSSTFQPSPFFRIGISLMNILGTELISNEDSYNKLRSVGVGISYQKNRFHLGSEIKLTERNKGIISFGVSFVPFNNATINIGICATEKTFSFGINYRNLYYNLNKNPQRGYYHLFGTRVTL